MALSTGFSACKVNLIILRQASRTEAFLEVFLVILKFETIIVISDFSLETEILLRLSSSLLGDQAVEETRWSNGQYNQMDPMVKGIWRFNGSDGRMDPKVKYGPGVQMDLTVNG